MRYIGVCVVAGVLVAGVSSGAAASGAGVRRVVILSGTDVMLPASLVQDRIIRETFARSLTDEPVEFYSEAVDAFRLPSEEYEPELVAFFERKFAKRPPDLIVATSEGSLGSLEKHRERLWKETPVVFSSVNPFYLRGRKPPLWSTGIMEDVDVEGTVRLAQSLQPEARRVIVVAGTAAWDASVLEGVARRLRAIRPPLEITVRTDVTTSRLQEEFGSLDPKSTFILYTSMFQDASGRVTVPRQIAGMLSSAASVPVYGLYSTYEGIGITSGSLMNFEAEGAAVAAVARRVLDGQAPAGEFLEPPPPLRFVDARQLARFRIPESRVPAGAVLRYRTPTAWEQYRWRIVAVAVAVFLETALLIALLAQRRGRRSAEEVSRRRTQELSHAGRLVTVGELTASISHEINQPLGAILANVRAAEMLLNRSLAPIDEVRQVLADIRKDDLRASEVIRHVRSLTANRAMEMEPVDLNAVAADVCGLLRSEALRRGVAPELDLAEDLPPVHGDRVCLEQVLMNLVLNAMDAVDHVPAERRRVVIRTRPADGERVALRVSDSGPGIASETLPRLFHSFFTTKTQGLGLGLSICRTIVEAHGGTIRAENDPAGGAAFRVTIPMPGAMESSPGVGES